MLKFRAFGFTTKLFAVPAINDTLEPDSARLGVSVKLYVLAPSVELRVVSIAIVPVSPLLLTVTDDCPAVKV